jgi:hypothetical protein
LYAQAFTNGYSYPAARVTISLDAPAQYFLSGSVAASGLKPNFAYQIKLTGNPSKSGMSDADDATNVVLGSNGRWWRLQPNPANSNDSDYNANKDTPGYVYEGYVLIAFFVTDAQGNASARFVGNNSFHVLWRLDQRQPGPNDGPPLDVNVPDTTGNPDYDQSVPARQYTLYGEWEPTRALPGALRLPSGHYRCRLFLTEESFHDYGALGGGWAVAMSAPLEFDLFGSGPPPPPVTAQPLAITRVRAALNFGAPGHDYVWVSGKLKLPSGTALEHLEVQASVLGVTRNFVLGRSGSCYLRDGILQLRRVRGGSDNAEFGLRIGHATVVLPQSAAKPGTVETAASLALKGQTYAGSVSAREVRDKNAGTLFYSGK